MEFGALIPLFYLSMCCIFITPIIGVSLTLYFHFGLKNKQLSKIVLLTVLSTGLLGFLYIPLTSIWGLYHYSQCCVEIGRQVNFWDLLQKTLPGMFAGSLWFAFLGSDLGFIISFIFIIPITDLFRRYKQKNSPDLHLDNATSKNDG